MYQLCIQKVQSFLYTRVGIEAFCELLVSQKFISRYYGPSTLSTPKCGLLYLCLPKIFRICTQIYCWCGTKVCGLSVWGWVCVKYGWGKATGFNLGLWEQTLVTTVSKLIGGPWKNIQSIKTNLKDCRFLVIIM